MTNHLLALALLAAMPLTPAFASTWNLASGETYDSSTNLNGDCLTEGSTYGNKRHCTADSVAGAPTIANASLVVTAWSNTYNSANTYLEAAYVGVYSGGLGVKNKDAGSNTTCDSSEDCYEWTSPEHAIDNADRVDSLLFSFDNSVALDKVTTGWVSAGDSDMSLWVYDAAGVPVLSGNNKSYASLGSGWKLVGHYDGNNAGSITVNKGGTVYSSSYWLLGAYNASVAGTCYKADGSSGGTCNSSISAPVGPNDYFKVASVTDKPSHQVPLPGTLLLLGAGLIGLGYARRQPV